MMFHKQRFLSTFFNVFYLQKRFKIKNAFPPLIRSDGVKTPTLEPSRDQDSRASSRAKTETVDPRDRAETETVDPRAEPRPRQLTLETEPRPRH
jgi:hypothetical protein